MFTLTTKATPHHAVLATEIKAEIVLLSLVTQQYYTLNESGAHIWRGLRDGLSVSEICQRLQEQYEVTFDHAQRSVETLLQGLLAEKLITL